MAEFTLTRSALEVDEKIVNRWARIAMYTGVFLVVGGLSKAHAVTHEYSWSSSTRFAWSLGYVALLCVAAYSVGLPEQPRTRRSAVVSALIAAGVAAMAISGVSARSMASMKS